MRVPFLLALLASLAGIWACSDSELAPIEISSIEPAEAPLGLAVDVEISGDAFHLQLPTDLGEKTIETDPIVVEIADTPLTDIVLIDENTISATVPGALSVGSHPLRIAFPDGRETTLSNAFAVTGRIPFGDITPIDVANTASYEDDPTLPSDMLELFYSRGTGPATDGDIWVATRASVDEPFSAPNPVDELNSGAQDGEVKISADGLTMNFSSTRGGNLDLYHSTRADRSSPWSPPVPITELNTNATETLLAVNADGTLGVFSRDVSFGNLELFSTERAQPSDPWGSLSPLDEINSDLDDGSGFLVASGLALYFYSGGRNTQIYVSFRGRTDLPWGNRIPLEELTTGGREEDPWVSPDGSIIYYASDGEILRATR